jgi:hypothetical protein
MMYETAMDLISVLPGLISARPDFPRGSLVTWRIRSRSHLPPGLLVTVLSGFPKENLDHVENSQLNSNSAGFSPCAVWFP